MAVTFHFADVKYNLKHKRDLKAFILNRLHPLTPKNINLSFIFCSDEYLLNINRQFLNHDYYTDIITFPLSEHNHKLEAEIYISIDRVKENSAKYSQTVQTSLSAIYSFEKELLRVMFHGVLHLLGYNDKTAVQKTKMRKAEEQWLKSFALITYNKKTAKRANKTHK